ncbi:N-acetylmuramoyl-L-alanine amidase family protein [Hyalangium versicolor]|uniref:N-acetylmuramoyl-L-alanine amidase family protein n=1 Tax=Hyalangium versicolor TaxID=2861190 RepID=UPI001CCE4B72|nr:N-acetylmuramoyl-L-alanine amidase [Hyalangium versicolor]
MSRVFTLLLVGLGLVGGVQAAHAQTASNAPSGDAPPTALPSWPAPGAPLKVLPLNVPKGFRKQRIYLDAGHGYRGNRGNSSVTCEEEADFTLRAAEDLARRLEATGHFLVRLSHKAGQNVAYRKRISEAEGWKADAFVSIHSDARGSPSWWEGAPGKQCLRQDSTPGFGVLWADDTAEPLKTQRMALARALARQLGGAGFLPYDGVDYVNLYDGDPEHPGVFVDRHEPRYRIMMLRRPRIPSVIIETHHALDFEEAARWKENRTLEAFAAAVARGLVDALSSPASPALPVATTGVADQQ